MTRKQPRRSNRKSKASVKGRRRKLKWLLLLLVAVCLLSLLVVDLLVRVKFEGKKWSLPSQVFARPLELYPGLPLQAEELDSELQGLGYQIVQRVTGPGQVMKNRGRYHIYSRGFRFWDGLEPAREFEVRLAADRVNQLRWLGDESVDSALLVRLEPQKIGGIYPAQKEDRLLVRLQDIPPALGEALIAVEDRNFTDHHGISLLGILRASWVNLRAGGVVQGGSTLTQQLVKNFYLNQDRSFVRKGLEVVMSLLLELHYSKAEILETYINEVYLGQSGSHAIHGFAQASQHYFHKPLGELSQTQLALLVAVVKGASYYNPWRHPERALERRNLVLQIMAREGLVDAQQLQVAMVQPLDVVASGRRPSQQYPAFMQLVKRQLQRDYQDQDLRSEGLLIFTSFSPFVQQRAEQALSSRLQALEAQRQLSPGKLQGAALLMSVGNAEVLALVGGRRAKFAGFNRALDMRRPVGSLIKPAVYLTALQQPSDYDLASRISDGPVTVSGPDGSLWRPRNFSRQSHGQVPLVDALAHSYNQATARLGMQLGLSRVKSTLVALGVGAPVPEVPAMLLGSVNLSPLEVATMYHTLAAEGVYSPPQAVRSVLTADHRPLQRYPLRVEQRVDAKSVYLLNYALQMTMHQGTGRSAYRQLPDSLAVAGKTGTTNGQRDSWFAGFSRDHLGVVWLGYDNNDKTPLTGSTGALSVWSEIMTSLSTRGLAADLPRGVGLHWVDMATGLASGENCRGAQQLPFIEAARQASAGQERAPCQWRQNPLEFWWQKLRP